MVAPDKVLSMDQIELFLHLNWVQTNEIIRYMKFEALLKKKNLAKIIIIFYIKVKKK